MTFRIETALLSDDEAERLYVRRPELRAGPHEFCPTCRKEGTYFWRGVEHPCDCLRQLQLCKHYSAAGIGDTYQRLDWADLNLPEEDEAALLPKVLKYLEHHDRYIHRGVGLLLYGTIGSGKTLVTNLVLKELVKLGYACFATTFADTIEAFTSTWGSAAKDNKAWFAAKFKHSQVLLLDDLGRELMTRTNLAQSTFDMILRARVQDGRPTLITTNCQPGELKTGYGAQVLSLITEQSMSYGFTGTDFRPHAQRRNQEEIEAGEMRPIV